MGFLLYFAAPWLLLGWVTAQLGLGRQGLDRRWLWSLYLALGIVLLGWLAISIFILATVRQILMRQISTTGHIVSWSADIDWRLEVWLSCTLGMLAFIFLGLAVRQIRQRLPARWGHTGPPRTVAAGGGRWRASRVWTVVQILLGLLLGLWGGVLGLVWLFDTFIGRTIGLPLVSCLSALALLLMVSLWGRE